MHFAFFLRYSDDDLCLLGLWPGFLQVGKRPGLTPGLSSRPAWQGGPRYLEVRVSVEFPGGVKGRYIQALQVGR